MAIYTDPNTGSAAGADQVSDIQVRLAVSGDRYGYNASVIGSGAVNPVIGKRLLGVDSNQLTGIWLDGNALILHLSVSSAIGFFDQSQARGLVLSVGGELQVNLDTASFGVTTVDIPITEPQSGYFKRLASNNETVLVRFERTYEPFIVNYLRSRLLTLRGTAILNPDFGSETYRYIGSNNYSTTSAGVIRSTLEALAGPVLTITNIRVLAEETGYIVNIRGVDNVSGIEFDESLLLEV